MRDGLRFANGGSDTGNAGGDRSPDARDDRAAGGQGARDGARDSSRADSGGHPQSERLCGFDGERRVELRGRNPVRAQERAYGAAREAAREYRIRTRIFTVTPPLSAPIESASDTLPGFAG